MWRLNRRLSFGRALLKNGTPDKPDVKRITALHRDSRCETKRGCDLTAGRAPIIGIAGGIGSGKSTVASIFEEMGARVIDSDRLNHEVLNTPDVLATLQQWWGPRVVASDGTADRAYIGRVVREDTASLRQLESLVHPLIAQKSERLIAAWKVDPNVTAIIWDAPLLFEVGLDQRCDVVVFVDADRAVRIERLRHGRNGTPEDWLRLEKSQKPLDFKKDKADYTIENNSNKESLRPRIREIFSRILSGT